MYRPPNAGSARAADAQGRRRTLTRGAARSAQPQTSPYPSTTRPCPAHRPTKEARRPAAMPARPPRHRRPRRSSRWNPANHLSPAMATAEPAAQRTVQHGTRSMPRKLGRTGDGSQQAPSAAATRQGRSADAERRRARSTKSRRQGHRTSYTRVTFQKFTKLNHALNFLKVFRRCAQIIFPARSPDLPKKPDPGI